jgi:hypothetical protein
MKGGLVGDGEGLEGGDALGEPDVGVDVGLGVGGDDGFDLEMEVEGEDQEKGGEGEVFWEVGAEVGHREKIGDERVVGKEQEEERYWIKRRLKARRHEGREVHKEVVLV